MHYLGTVIEKLVSPDEGLRRAERRQRGQSPGFCDADHDLRAASMRERRS